MSRIDRLLKRYERFVSLPWEKTLAGPQRVWFVIYNKTDERRIRNRMPEFELATKDAGHGWHLVDLTVSFPHWMAAQKYREGYFSFPEGLETLLHYFLDHVINQLKTVMAPKTSDTNSVIAIMGIASLFGFMKVSEIINAVANHVLGRLVVFFPGEYENNNYRLLDARDGWNYLAVPISAAEGL